MKKKSVLLIALFISSWHIADTSPHIVTGEEYSYTPLQDKPSQKNSRKEVTKILLEDEAVALLQAYLQVDTISPPGNESRAVDFLAKIFDKEGVEIKAQGTFIQGIIGIGGEKKGNLEIIENNDSDFNEDCKDSIIVLESYLSYELYKKATEIGVKGIVCGGIDYMTLSKILGYPLGVAITGMEEVTTVIVTEGFGNLKMAEKTLNLLKKYNNKFCSINGATQIRAGVLRPEIIISSDKDINANDSFNEDDLVISVGSQVRVIRNPHFGKIGVVSELPSDLVKIDTETISRVAKIKFKNGENEIIPRANLEVILSD